VLNYQETLSLQLGHAEPQGQHLSTKLKTQKTQTRKMAATEVYKQKSDVIGY